MASITDPNTPVQAKQFLTFAKLPTTQANIDAVTAWLAQENGPANNPLGANYTAKGGLPDYGSNAAGLQAAANLFSSSPAYQAAYKNLQASNPTGFIAAIAQSPWAAPTHYGWPGTNNLLTTYNDVLMVHGAAPNLNVAPVTVLGNTAAAAGGILGSVPNAIALVGVILIGIAFLGVGGLIALKGKK